MVETILPRRTSTLVAHPQYAASAASSREVAASIDVEAKPATASLLPQEEDYELVSFEPEAEVKKDFLEEAEESFGWNDAPAQTISTEVFASPAQPEALDNNDLSKAADSPDKPLFKSIGSTVNQSHAEPSAQSVSTAEHIDESIATPAGAEAEPASKLNAAIDESAIDPWDDPLPAWEYSRNEWPLVVESKKPSAFAKLKMPIAIGALAVCAILVYFLIMPKPEAPQETISVVTPELTETPATDDAPEASTAAPDDAQPQATTPATNATPPEAVAADGGNVKWQHSLQAMASQKEAEATQFAERLQRAGVPAYVVTADLGRRGRWHRVRVGRFLTVDEAMRFAIEARARAKAAGVTLKDLNLCDYEKP